MLAFCFVSLNAIPPTAGFVAKIYIFIAAVQSELVWLVIVAVLNSELSAFYYLRVVSHRYLAPAPVEGDIRVGPWLAASLAVTSVGVLVVGLVPTPLLDAAERAVTALG